MNREEFEAKFAEGGTSFLAWVKGHQKISMVVGSMLVGLLLGVLWTHR